MATESPNGFSSAQPRDREDQQPVPQRPIKLGIGSGDTILPQGSPGSPDPEKGNTSTIKLSAQKTTALQPGGLFRRLVALIVDGAILSILYQPLAYLLTLLFFFMSGSQDLLMEVGSSQLVLNMINFVFGIVGAFFYFGWFYNKKGATPGKMLLGLKVVDHKTGSYISWKRAFFREVVGKLISSIILGIGYIMAGFRSDKRALHDLMFSTQVVQRKV